MEAKTVVILKCVLCVYLDLSVFIVIQTSNVFVANLPPHVNEQSLGMFFARMGPVGSVSIVSAWSIPVDQISGVGQNNVAPW